MASLSPRDMLFRTQRLQSLSRRGNAYGLDSIQVSSVGPVRWKLSLGFFGGSGKVPPGISLGNVRVVLPPGSPDPGFRVLSVSYAPPDPETGSRPGVVDVVVDVEDRSQGLQLSRDPTVYSLELVGVEGLDRFFSSAPFSLGGKSLAPRITPPTSVVRSLPPIPDIDYLTKDFNSFRKLMLDHMTRLVPGWRERNAVDLGVAVIEILAYVADYLSYYQDAAATEAYLNTARRRVSVRRHARLLDYQLSEGCNSRLWVQVSVASGDDAVELPRGTAFLTECAGVPPVIAYGSRDYQRALEQGSHVFESMTDGVFYREHNEISIHTWGVEEMGLAAGRTDAALSGHLLHLKRGEVLIFEQVRDPRTGRVEDVDPNRRAAVRLTRPPRFSTDSALGAPITEIEWSEEDALPFDLPVVSAVSDQPLAVVRGNLVLADHGRTVEEDLPPVVPGDIYRPHLRYEDVTFAYHLKEEAGAAKLLEQIPWRAQPVIRLWEVGFESTSLAPGTGLTWRPQPHLLASDRFAREFVVEVESDGSAQLRFGDGDQGAAPIPGTRFRAIYRVGKGPVGNIGPETLVHAVSDNLGISRVRNPMSAVGGTEPESLSHARLFAPSNMRSQNRCVKPQDFVQVAERHAEVVNAVTQLRWTGSWMTAFVYVHRQGGKAVSAAFRREMLRYMRPLLIAGMGLEIRPPALLPVEIQLIVKVESGIAQGSTLTGLERTFSDGVLPDGNLAYFHPDRFSFGQPLFMSDIVATALRVAGVTEVEVGTFRRWTELGDDSRTTGRIEPGPLEIISVRNSAEAPQLGGISFLLRGGR